MAAIDMLLRRHLASGRALPPFVVLVGGTALAAHAVRSASEDIDLFANEPMDEAVREVEQSLRERHGPAFKVDVTSGENLWGQILVRDIANSPPWQELEIEGRKVGVRVLPLEDLFLLKLAAARAKDEQDLRELAPRIALDALVARFGMFARWHSNRAALAGYADAFVRRVAELWKIPPAEIISRVDLPPHIKEMLRDAYE